MISKASEQLLEELAYPSLAEFLQTGGVLEIGHDPSLGSFARIRMRNKTWTVQGIYRDFEAVLKQMNSTAKEHSPVSSNIPNH